MVVRVQMFVLATPVAQVLERAVRDHLVGVHVGRGAGTSLDHVDDELIVQCAFDQVVAGAHDRLRTHRIDHAQFEVGLRRRLLDERECTHEFGPPRHGLAGDREVLDRPGAVHAPVGSAGDLALTEEVALAASGRAGGVVCRGVLHGGAM